MDYKVEAGDLSEKVKREIGAITMKAGTLEVAYVWWEGLEYWQMISLTEANQWPANTMLTTAWTVRNVGDEEASFKVVFSGGGMDVESTPVRLKPNPTNPGAGETGTLYAYPTTPASGSYECTLTIYADNEIVEYWPDIPVVIVPVGKADLYGFVHDSKGNPLPAVSVSLNQHKTATLLDGTFDFPNVAAGPYTITCTKTGYKDFNKDITLSVGDNEVDITMLAEEEEEGIWEWIKAHWKWIAGGAGAAAAIGVTVVLVKKRK